MSGPAIVTLALSTALLLGGCVMAEGRMADGSSFKVTRLATDLAVEMDERGMRTSSNPSAVAQQYAIDSLSRALTLLVNQRAIDAMPPGPQKLEALATPAGPGEDEWIEPTGKRSCP